MLQITEKLDKNREVLTFRVHNYEHYKAMLPLLKVKAPWLKLKLQLAHTEFLPLLLPGISLVSATYPLLSDSFIRLIAHASVALKWTQAWQNNRSLSLPNLARL